MLSSAEVDRYQDDGYVIPRFRLEASHVLALRTAMDGVIAQNPETRPERLVSVHTKEKGVEGVLGDEIFLELARDEQILDLVEPLIGPNIILWGCQAFCKPPGDGMEVPWHQDGHYWPIKPLETCTVWVAIDDSVIENGCLRVVPGSHRERSLYGHLKEDREDVVLNQRLESAYLDETQAVDVELEAGQLSMHDVYLIHGSNSNRSTRRRAGIAMRYMPATSLFDRGVGANASAGYTVDYSNRPLWLVRGTDLTGVNDFQVGHG